MRNQDISKLRSFKLSDLKMMSRKFANLAIENILFIYQGSRLTELLPLIHWPGNAL